MKPVYRGLAVTIILLLIGAAILVGKLLALPEPEELATKHDVIRVEAAAIEHARIEVLNRLNAAKTERARVDKSILRRR